MDATHVVLRRFPGPESIPLEPGTRVNASEWRNRERLVTGRYLKPLPEGNTKPSDDHGAGGEGRGGRRGGR